MKSLCGVLLVLVGFFGLAQENQFSRPDIPGELMLDIGINAWSQVPDTLDRKGWASKSVGIYYMKRYPISNKLSFYPGIGLGLEKHGFQSAATFIDSADYIDALPFFGITKNKLAITYFDIPIEFRFHPNGTEDGEGFFIGIGAMGGVRMNAHTKWVYEVDGDKKRQKVSGNFNLETFRYGFQVRLGFRGIHLYYKSYQSTLFNSPIQEADPQVRTIGINLTGF